MLIAMCHISNIFMFIDAVIEKVNSIQYTLSILEYDFVFNLIKTFIHI